MRIAVCPGSFDPVTNGHIDIFERSANIVDKMIVAVFVNPTKKPMFSTEERVQFLREATKHLNHIEVDCFSGLLYEYLHKRNCNLIIRGLRAFSDFEYEFQRALLIKHINPDIETAFIMTNGEYSFLSSTGVRELAHFGGDISQLVPACVSKEINGKFKIKI